MKCAKADTVFMYIFILLRSGNGCSITRILMSNIQFDGIVIIAGICLLADIT